MQSVEAAWARTGSTGSLGRNGRHRLLAPMPRLSTDYLAPGSSLGAVHMPSPLATSAAATDASIAVHAAALAFQSCYKQFIPWS